MLFITNNTIYSPQSLLFSINSTRRNKNDILQIIENEGFIIPDSIQIRDSFEHQINILIACKINILSRIERFYCKRDHRYKSIEDFSHEMRGLIKEVLNMSLVISFILFHTVKNQRSDIINRIKTELNDDGKGNVLTQDSASSKKEAEQKVSRLALIKFGLLSE